jgi:hypothetical protein
MRSVCYSPKRRRARLRTDRIFVLILGPAGRPEWRGIGSDRGRGARGRIKRIWALPAPSPATPLSTFVSGLQALATQAQKLLGCSMVVGH